MAGTISFGGIGSGMDTEAIVSGLVKASRGQADALKQRISSNQAAESSISSLSSLLATLKTSVDALATPDLVSSYKATSSSSAITVSAAGNALPGKYSISVDNLAQEQRTYSNTFSGSKTALNQSGTLRLQVGSGTAKDLTISADDTLESIATKINGSGLRVSASVFNDGTSYRLQVRGLDTGAANAVTFNESGTTLGLNTPENTFQAAKDAKLTIDGHTVTRATNQISGVIQGVTFNLEDKPTGSVSLQISGDPKTTETKLQAFVTAYNAVINQVHTTAGWGKIKASNEALAGDSTLRGLTERLSGTVLASDTDLGALSSLGIKTNKDGTLALDTTKFEKALGADPAAVTNVLAGAGSKNGVMDKLSTLVNNYTQTGNGLLLQRQETFKNQGKSLQDRVDREEERLSRYAESLRKQFTQMDSTVAGNNAQFDYLSRLYSGS